MRICHVANHRPSWSWKRDLSDGFRAHGHDVVDLQDDEPVQIPAGTDLVVWSRHHRHHPNVLPDVAVHLDLYWSLARREAEVGRGPFWTAPFVFTADGGHQAAFRARGVNHHWLPPALAERHIGRGDHRPELACDVAFVGSRRHHPEWPDRARLVAHLEQRWRAGFRWYGPGSPHGEARGRRLADVLASARVVVGDSANPGYRLTRYWSDRVPITLGRGGFLAHPAVGGLAEQHPQVVCWPFGRFDLLDGLIERWLGDPDGRRDATDRAMADIAARHTWAERAGRILEAVGA